LLRPDEGFDDIKAINRLCSDAKKLLCFAANHRYLAPYVGRMKYEPGRYASIDDMLAHAERMFLRHERRPVPQETDVKQYLKKLVGWRETIF